MSCPVMRRHLAVLGLDQHVAILIDENGAEGMVAVGQGAAGDLERPAQKMLIEFGRPHIRNAVHGRSFRSAHHADGKCDKQASGSGHDPEKWKPVFGKSSCPPKKTSDGSDSAKLLILWIVCEGVKHSWPKVAAADVKRGRRFRSFAGCSSRLWLLPIWWLGLTFGLDRLPLTGLS